MSYEVKDFNIDVIQASHSKPVLVDFWAEWCGPCRILGPVLERLASQNNGEWILAKVNSDEYAEISAKYGIRSIPNVKLFHKGEVINEFVGALPEAAIKEWLKKNIPNKYQDLIFSAEALISSGNDSEAERILNEALVHDPQNQTARLLLAKIHLFKNTSTALELIQDVEETIETAERLNSIKTICSLLDQSIRSSLEESPTKELYLTAITHLKNMEFELSLEKFIEIIRSDRFYNDDGARKACIAIFKHLGEENPITLTYRREFGRVLYV
jgi:putative thioredoxin